MVRFIYSFVVGVLSLNLQASAMINDMEPVDPAEQWAGVPRCQVVPLIEKVANWKDSGRDFGSVFRPNRTYFALALGLNGPILDTFYVIGGPSQEDVKVFDKIEGEITKAALKATRLGFNPSADIPIPTDILIAYQNYLKAEDNYEAQKDKRLAEERQRRLAEEEDNRPIAALSEKDSFITSAGKRIASFMKFCPRIAPDFAEL